MTPTRNGFECYICEAYIPDGQGFTVVNNRTQDSLSCHRACVTTLLSPLKRSLALHSQLPRNRRRPRA